MRPDYEDLSYMPARVDNRLLDSIGYDYMSDALKGVWSEAMDAGKRYGYRNAQVTVLAPTGTIAFAMDCATTSSEPFFSHVVYKKLVGGNFMEIINPCIPQTLEKLGYSLDEINDITAYVLRKEGGVIVDGKIEGAPHLRTEHYKIFDTANKCGTGERYILPEGHVKMMAALTPNVTGAISKTVNVPNSATEEDIKNIYLLSWKLGVKAIAIYRDGCKETQPLNTAAGANKEKTLEELPYDELLEKAKNTKPIYKPLRVKPSGIRSARVHEACINGLKLYITTSFYENGNIGELYVSSGRQGSLVKGLLDSISTTISEMLQYGVPAEDISRMYRGQKFEPSGFVTGHPYIKYVDSISDLISKIIDIELNNFTYCQAKPDFIDSNENSLQAGNTSFVDTKNYSAKDFLYGEVCPVCKSNKMIKNGTCKVCTECGSSTGCS
jgi:ribonucleoside-diphosphate reductase alpha chain